jgi:hypothetical protein
VADDVRAFVVAERLRISFDVDETLVCTAADVPTERPLPWLLRRWFPEQLRQGALALMHELILLGFEIWIYTTSSRSSWYLKVWFRLLGVRLAGVVNDTAHARLARCDAHGQYLPSKYPPAFGIDLHVDDSPGVGLEGVRHGFDVVVVSPGDPEWTNRVLDYARRRAGL